MRDARSGSRWFMMMYPGAMPTTDKVVRQSVSLPARVAKRVRTLAKASRASANRVIIDLIEAGLDAQDAERKQFFDLADRLTREQDPAEQKRLKDQLARMTFGD